MSQNSTQSNINALATWFIPLIIAAKAVRWTIMYDKLVAMSIGNGMVNKINNNWYPTFHPGILSELTNAGNLTEYNTGALCQIVNTFLGIQTTTGWEIFITIVFNIILFFLIKDFYERTPTAGRKENFFIYLSIAILNIFCFNLSKEPYQMLFFILMGSAIKAGKSYQQKSFFLTGAIIITVLFSRKYFGLILIYFFILQYIVRNLFDNVDLSSSKGKGKLVGNILISGLLLAVCHFFLLSFLSVSNEDTYSEMMNANYRDMERASVADSEIVPIFAKGNPLMAAADYAIKIFRLMFPIELLLKGKVTYILLVCFQWLIAGFIANAFITRSISKKKVKKQEDEEEEDEEEEIEEEGNEEDMEEDEEDNEDDDEEDNEAVWSIKKQERTDTRTAALYLYIAFLLCSAAFEPDFGSWLRHEAITFPILLLLI